MYVQNKLFWNNISMNFVAYIFMLFLAPFASKLADYSRCSESLNICKKSKPATFSFENNDLSILQMLTSLRLE